MALKTVVTMNRYQTESPITGNPGEITFDTETMEMRFHDGVTQDGLLLGSDMMANVGLIMTMVAQLNDMMGEDNGIATLDANGKIPLTQLPEVSGGTPIVMPSISNLDGGFF